MLTRTIQTCKKISVAAAVLTLTACGSVQVESQSFRVNKNSSVESAQIAIDADFSRYDQLLATGLGIYFPQSHLTTAEDIARIRQIFRAAFLEQLKAYNIVDKPGPSTMTVEASLIDMRNAVADQIPNMRREIRDMAKPGSILFLMELRDSETDRVLARAADSAKAPTISGAGGVETDWASIEDAALHWAALFRTFLDENFANKP
jgi:5-enolpyruvylshikimate-3-phosphate synthase